MTGSPNSYTAEEVQELIGKYVARGGASIEQTLAIAGYIIDLNRDAARYRWLNKKYDMLLRVGIMDDKYSKQNVALKCGEPLDRWIDQHIEAEFSLPTTPRSPSDV